MFPLIFRLWGPYRNKKGAARHHLHISLTSRKPHHCLKRVFYLAFISLGSKIGLMRDIERPLWPGPDRNASMLSRTVLYVLFPKRRHASRIQVIIKATPLKPISKGLLHGRDS